jgi:hypothetical protein
VFGTRARAKVEVVVLRESRDDLIIARSWLSTVENPLVGGSKSGGWMLGQMVIVIHVRRDYQVICEEIYGIYTGYIWDLC